jgi:membrane-bound serine protease (ClpP class)
MHAGSRPGSPRRTLLKPLLGLVLTAAGVLLLVAPAHGQPRPTRFVDVYEASGWLDPIVVDGVERAIRTSERNGAEVLIIRLDSPGALVSDDTVDRLARRIAVARVPIAVWVGGVGAEALGGAARLVEAAPVSGMARGSRIEAPEGRVGSTRAVELGLVDIPEEGASDLRTFLLAIDGRQAAGQTIDVADVRPGEEATEAEATVEVRLAKLDLWPRTMHTVASPPVAYLLLCAGLALLVFELFTAGVGIAGMVGALSLLLAAYGLAVLPTNPVGLALIALAMFGFAVDVQTGVPRVWTGVGVVALVVGSLLLYDDPVSLGWLPLVAGVLGVVLLMLAGLPATVRSRFSTPTIGRESMVGELGEAVVGVKPDGVVEVRGALWPAHANRSTPIEEGDRVRVVAVEGPRLTVEPATQGS